MPQCAWQNMKSLKTVRSSFRSLSIAGFQGVWANADSLEACRDDLQSVLEDWLILGLRMGHELPIVAGINLAAAEAH